MQLTVLGSGSALPVPGRSPASQLLRFDNADYLIDCGEGTQMQLRRFGLSMARIRAIFISHLHGDHYLGLMGLLWSMDLSGRRKRIALIAPEGIERLIEIHLNLACATLNFGLDILPIGDSQTPTVYEDSNIKVEAFSQQHRIPCFGYSFTEPKKARNLIKEKIARLGLPHHKLRALKAGEDVKNDRGELIRAVDVTTGPKPSRRYVYCTDTRPQTLPDSARCADLLYHEATYDHGLSDRAEKMYHSTSVQAAEVALESGAKKLIIGHFSSRYRDAELLLKEAQGLFPDTVAAEDGLTVRV